MLDESLTSPVRRKRRSAPRTTTGCLCCRIRRKKCDERKPDCTGCIRNGLLCSFATEAAPDSDSDSKSGLTLPDASQQNPGDSPGVYRDGGSPGSLNSVEIYPTTWNSEPNSKFSTFKKDASNPRRAANAPYSGIRAPGTPWLGKATSRALFEHYTLQTGHQLGGISGPENPFIVCILPLALLDGLIMHSVLALSGSHLTSHSDNEDLKQTTFIHYGLAVRGLKHALTQRVASDDAETMRLLVTTLLLSQVESVSGKFDGAVFHHLRASRQFVLSLFDGMKAQHDENLRGFVLELYAYLALVHNITLNFESKDRLITFDHFLFSLDSLGCSKSSGVMFGCAHGLFELIPRVCQLGFDRRKEQLSGITSKDTITTYQYALLEAKIAGWKPPEHQYSSQWLTAAEVYQHALLIFLHTTFYGSEVQHPVLLFTVDKLIEESLLLFRKTENWGSLEDLPSPSAIATTFLWPSIIIGSCARDPLHREYIRSSLANSPYKMNIVTSAIQLLDWLWEDENDYAYGPYGLEMVMKKLKVNFCMS